MTRQQSGDWTYDDEPPAEGDGATVARLEWVLDALTKLGVQAKPSSRLPASIRFLKELDRVN
jgi:hypothetical protein